MWGDPAGRPYNPLGACVQISPCYTFLKIDEFKLFGYGRIVSKRPCRCQNNLHTITITVD